MDGKHLMRVQSETSVSNLLWHCVDDTFDVAQRAHRIECIHYHKSILSTTYLHGLFFAPLSRNFLHIS